MYRRFDLGWKVHEWLRLPSFVDLSSNTHPLTRLDFTQPCLALILLLGTLSRSCVRPDPVRGFGARLRFHLATSGHRFHGKCPR